MPIYEFYCPGCNTIFSFLSKTVNTTKRPGCPRCKGRRLQRQVSAFALTGSTGSDDEMDDFPVDETKMEAAINALAGEAENISEDDPKQAARLMRKFSNMAGMEFGDGMNEAIGRMEAGEDPEKIEAEMGDLMNEEEPFVLADRKGKSGLEGERNRSAPARDETLHEM